MPLLACGYGSTIVIVGGKQGQVRSCGGNAAGQLGHGTTAATGELSDLAGDLKQKRAVAVAAGLAHALALSEFGSVFAWGAGHWGQVGDGRRAVCPLPREVKGVLTNRRVKAIAGGDCHSLAVTDDGQLFAWGGGECGQLGVGSTDDVLSPVQIGGALTGRRVKQVAAGGDHSLALLEEGRLFAWGSNSYGQLGTGGREGWQLVPIEVGGALGAPATRALQLTHERVKGIAAGGMHSLALTESGLVFSWGNGFNGQLGLGSTHDEPQAAQVFGILAGVTVKLLAAGAHHSAALSDSGHVYTWGCGECGQLGCGTLSDACLPVLVVWRQRATEVNCGGHHTAALTAEGKLFTWGSGQRGQLGLGNHVKELKLGRVVPLAEMKKVPTEVSGVLAHQQRSPAKGLAAIMASARCTPRVAVEAAATAAAQRERRLRFLHWRRPAVVADPEPGNADVATDAPAHHEAVLPDLLDTSLPSPPRGHAADGQARRRERRGGAFANEPDAEPDRHAQRQKTIKTPRNAVSPACDGASNGEGGTGMPDPGQLWPPHSLDSDLQRPWEQEGGAASPRKPMDARRETAAGEIRFREFLAKMKRKEACDSDGAGGRGAGLLSLPDQGIRLDITAASPRSRPRPLRHPRSRLHPLAGYSPRDISRGREGLGQNVRVRESIGSVVRHGRPLPLSSRAGQTVVF